MAKLKMVTLTLMVLLLHGIVETEKAVAKVVPEAVAAIFVVFVESVAVAVVLEVLEIVVPVNAIAVAVEEMPMYLRSIR